jgi:hypothetical protein
MRKSMETLRHSESTIMTNSATINPLSILTSILIAVAAISICSCSGKKATQIAVPVAEAGKTSNMMSSGPALDVDINGKTINYLSNRINDVRALLGRDQTEKLFGYGDMGKVFWELDSDGISVIYDRSNGVFRDIVIENGSYLIEGGGRVGDTKRQIVSKYPKGFFPDYNGETKKDTYFYLNMDAKNEAGVGFKFYFDKNDRVRKIDLGYWAFVQ